MYFNYGKKKRPSMKIYHEKPNLENVKSFHLRSGSTVAIIHGPRKSLEHRWALTFLQLTREKYCTRSTSRWWIDSKPTRLCNKTGRRTARTVDKGGWLLSHAHCGNKSHVEDNKKITTGDGDLTLTTVKNLSCPVTLSKALHHYLSTM